MMQEGDRKQGINKCWPNVPNHVAIHFSSTKVRSYIIN